MTKTADIIKILAAETKIVAWHRPERMMLAIPHEALDAAWLELGGDLEQTPRPYVPDLAARLGIGPDELYAALAADRGLTIVEDETGAIDEDGEYVPVTTGTTISDLLERIDVTGGPDGSMHDPELGWLPTYWLACEKCGVKGVHEDLRHDYLKEQEAAEWLVTKGIDPRGIEELPEISMTPAGKFYCDNCYEEDEDD